MFKAHIKMIVLKELSRQELSGYDLMKQLSELGKRPSPGYIYPLLKSLKEKGFISAKKEERRKIYSITAKGNKLLADLRKNREDMLKRMARLWKPIADKEEIEKFISLKKEIHKEQFKDKDILQRFHKTLFSVYKKEDTERRKRIRGIIDEAIKKMERLG